MWGRGLWQAVFPPSETTSRKFQVGSYQVGACIKLIQVLHGHTRSMARLLQLKQESCSHAASLDFQVQSGSGGP